MSLNLPSREKLEELRTLLVQRLGTKSILFEYNDIQERAEMVEKTCAHCKHYPDLDASVDGVMRFCGVAKGYVGVKYVNTKVRPCCEFEGESLKNKEEQK